VRRTPTEGQSRRRQEDGDPFRGRRRGRRRQSSAVLAGHSAFGIARRVSLAEVPLDTNSLPSHLSSFDDTSFPSASAGRAPRDFSGPLAVAILPRRNKGARAPRSWTRELLREGRATEPRDRCRALFSGLLGTCAGFSPAISGARRVAGPRGGKARGLCKPAICPTRN
jgi:hypothetical protein